MNFVIKMFHIFYFTFLVENNKITFFKKNSYNLWDYVQNSMKKYKNLVIYLDPLFINVNFERAALTQNTKSVLNDHLIF